MVDPVKTLAINLLLGVLFGFILTRAGVADFGHVTGMFSLTDFHMYGVIGTAVPIGALGLYILRNQPGFNGRRLPPPKKARHPGNLPGGLLFGLGWALTGACPGTSLVQLASGHWSAIVTIIGASAGIFAYRVVHKRYFSWNLDTCG